MAYSSAAVCVGTCVSTTPLSLCERRLIYIWLVSPVHCRELAFTLVPELCSVWNRCRVLVSTHDISKETIPCCVVLHGRRLLAHQNYSKNWERSQYLFCEMPKPTYVTHAQQLHNPFKYHAQQSCFLRWSILENTRLGKGFIPTCQQRGATSRHRDISFLSHCSRN